MTLRRRLVPYWLLGPGAIWLALFFVVPMYFMGELALRTGHLQRRASAPRSRSRTSATRSRGNTEQLVRSFFYAGTATLIALLIAYPLAYAIALRAGRWKLLLLFAVVAPFFTTYLIRTIAWKTILADDSPVVDVLQFLAPGPRGRPRAGDRRRRDRGADLQLPAVHDPADLRAASSGWTRA